MWACALWRRARHNTRASTASSLTGVATADSILRTRFGVGTGWRVVHGGVVARPILGKTNHNATLKLRDNSYVVLVLVAQCNHAALSGHDVLVALTTRAALRGTMDSPVFGMPIVFCNSGARQSSYHVVSPAEIVSVHTGYIVDNPHVR